MNGLRLPASVVLRDALYAGRSRRASDLHLDAGAPPTLRIDGELEALSQPALQAGELEEIVDTLLDEQQRARVRCEGDGSVRWQDPDLGDMRVHVYHCSEGPAIAIRLLEPRIPSLESLQLPEVVATLADRDRGMIVLAGPTGSGKSTTMAALLAHINAGLARRIITIEDPIEYRQSHGRSLISQREVGRDTPDLAMALRGALRADPDIIAIGEMRDPEAMKAALIAAETGHLVVATLHTGDACQTIDRIVDAFDGPLQAQIRITLAQVLIAVVCQHLIKRASGSGRRAAVEVLVATDAVRNLIRDSKAHQLKNAIALGRQFGMQTLEQHVAELLAAREIDATEAQRFGVTPALPDGGRPA
jgi:twitching motility protein PilT